MSLDLYKEACCDTTILYNAGTPILDIGSFFTIKKALYDKEPVPRTDNFLNVF